MSSTSTEEHEQGRWQSAFRAMLLDSMPPTYEDGYSRSVRMLRSFRQAAAEFLGPRLNEQLNAMAQDTLAEKQTLATWVNEQLRAMGLAIRCPKTGLPGILKADFKDADHDTSRFRVEVWDPRRGRYQSFSSTTLWDLTLIEAPPRRESFSRGFGRPGREDRPR